MHTGTPTGFKRVAVLGLATAFSIVAQAQSSSDYTQGVTVSGTTATIWFKSNVATSWVDVHYQVDGGAQQNVRMTYVGADGKDEQAVTVAAGDTISYWFTYNNGTPAYDTPASTYVVGSGNTASGPACFYADANYGGDSFCASADSSWVGSTWNDRVSSVKVQSGYEADLYQDVNYGGSVAKLTGNTPDLGALGFNDAMSSFHLLTATSTIPTSDTPDFGPNVKIFDPGTPAATIQSALDAAFNAQYQSPTAQFGSQRYAFLFKPGTYSPTARLGFYTTVEGLGLNPDDVQITGNLVVDSGWNYGDTANATQNFWRSAEDLAVTPSGGTMEWAVSQAAPLRHIHVEGNLHMGPTNQGNGQGYSSGGFIADSRVDGIVSTGSQQQWYTRDSNVGQWYDGVWNTVFSGVVGAPAQQFPSPPYTTLATTPASREKPYLYVDSSGKYHVWVPALRTNASGASWASGSTTPGSSIPMSQFYVTRPGDTAATMNAALAAGLNLFLTPGVYSLEAPLNVTRANTVILGLGFPTLQPTAGNDAMDVADVDGVKIAGILFDAGTTNSAALLKVGPGTSSTSHAANPTTVQDVFFRIGGAVAGKATDSLVVNSNDVIVDDIWAWRADHGSAPVGWTVNTASTGLLVNGARVLATGLFVEHYQQYQVLWNGENGRTIFFQNEMPYDVPSQAAWTSGNGNGWAAYKVGAGVQNHEAWGLGSYCFFNIGGTNTNINAARGFEVPVAAGVKMHDLLTVSLGGNGTITNVIDTTGATAQGASTVPVDVVSFP
ncbi:MAG TPA: peptidase inhibitor family I36 protein [Burkholderiaceae bacterium]